MKHRRFAKVFGIGLPKTGTTTLSAMLERLGYAHAPYDLGLIERVADGDTASLWPFIERYDAFGDWPWPVVYPEVDAALPGSAFILTVRKDGPTWLESAQKHESIRSASTGLDLEGPASRISRRIWGHADVFEDADAQVTAYLAHREGAHAHFRHRPDQFLEVCWETGSGWADLCDFLGHPVVEGPLPHENASADRARRMGGFQRRVRRLLRRLIA